MKIELARLKSVTGFSELEVLSQLAPWKQISSSHCPDSWAKNKAKKNISFETQNAIFYSFRNFENYENFATNSFKIVQCEC